MPRWDKKRWVRLPDGSYKRRSGVLRALERQVKGQSKPVYASMTRDRLIAESKRRGIASYGTKEVLIARLEEDDAEVS